jgi:hypothetical protein
MKDFLRDNSLSIVLAVLFAVFLGGQAISGWRHYNEEQNNYGQPPVALVEYLQTGAFGEAVFENWESEFLQMGLYVILTVFLIQRGSAESRDPDKPENENLRSNLADAPSPVRKGGGPSNCIVIPSPWLLRSFSLPPSLDTPSAARTPTMKMQSSMAKRRSLSGNTAAPRNSGLNLFRTGKVNS